MTLKLLRRWAPGLFLILIIGTWELVPTALHVKPYVFPSLSSVLQEAFEIRVLILANTRVTVLEALAGLSIGVSVGLLLGVLMSESVLLRRMLLPYVIGSNSIPVVAVSPLVATWLGYGFASKGSNRVAGILHTGTPFPLCFLD